MKKAHPCLSYFVKSPLEGIDTRHIHHFLIQTVPASYYALCKKKYSLLSLIHPGFSNFSVWPLVPLTFEFFVNSSLMSILVNPLYILKTCIKSCLFLISSNVHKFRCYSVQKRQTVRQFGLTCPQGPHVKYEKIFLVFL